MKLFTTNDKANSKNRETLDDMNKFVLKINALSIPRNAKLATTN